MLMNYKKEFEKEEMESAKIHLNTLSGYTGFGEGLYHMTAVKRMKSKEDFLKMPLKEIASNGTSTRSNPYSRFGLHIRLQRLVRPYVYQYFLPCISIVLVSFISFVVPLTAIPGRVALVVTQCLTLTNIFIYQRVRKR